MKLQELNDAVERYGREHGTYAVMDVMASWLIACRGRTSVPRIVFTTDDGDTVIVATVARPAPEE